MQSCAKHPHEKGIDLCRRCGTAWCSDCLVYAFGAKKPPYCMSCAMFAGGVRTACSRRALPKREIKALQKAAKAEAKAAARGGQASREERKPEPADAAAASDVEPAPAASEWDTPWWEERQPTFAD